MNARFHAPGAQAPGGLVSLPDEEAEHLSRVLRLTVGSPVRVFDGAGHEFEAVVETVTKSEARVRVGQAVTPAPELVSRLVLAPAVLKGDKMDDVVRDAVMLGVSAIQPVLSERSEVSAAVLRRAHRRERWERIAISSVKQCGRAVVPSVEEPRAFDEWLRTSCGPEAVVLMLVEPAASADSRPLRDLPTVPPKEVLLLVGPEGGWSPAEVALSARTCQLITMGRLTLRADATASIAIAALQTHWGLL